ncbi:hypothetical protein ACFQAS_12865 [Halopenitus salinus]|jgi:hypothetical protein|uniref:Uncharacterized protein n=1 Tax=Halopenitus salinus TaxID=1198295 RepID=A0ABD5UUK7_9EURY
MTRSHDHTIAVDSRRRRPERIRDATERLATVLQSLDLEEETQIAEEVIEAIKATDRAYQLETTTLEPTRRSGGFRFPSAPVDEVDR